VDQKIVEANEEESIKVGPIDEEAIKQDIKPVVEKKSFFDRFSKVTLSARRARNAGKSYSIPP